MVDFNDPKVIFYDFREQLTAKHVISRILIESVFRTVAVTKLWHALAGLYL